MAMPVDRPLDGPAAPSGSGSRQRTTLAGASTLHALHDGMSDGLSVLLPLLTESFGLSYAQAAALRTMFQGALGLLQLPAGILAERFDGRLVLALGTLMAGISFALMSVAPGYAMLLMLAVIAGTGSAVQHPLASTMVSKSAPPEKRRSALGVYNAAGDVGKMGGAFALATLAGYAGWQSGVLAYGILVALAGAAVLLLHRNASAATASEVKLEDRTHETVPSGLGLRDARGFWLLSAINVCEGVCRYGFTTFLPFLLTGKGATIGTVGVALMLLFIGGAAGKFICGFIAERVGIVRTIVLTEIATGVLVLAVVAAPLSLAMALLLPLGVVLNGTSSVLYGTVGDFVHEDRQSRAFGFFYTISSLTSALAPLAFGLLSDASSVVTALIVAGSIVFLTLPLAAFLAPHLSPRKA